MKLNIKINISTQQIPHTLQKQMGAKETVFRCWPTYLFFMLLHDDHHHHHHHVWIGLVH